MAADPVTAVGNALDTLGQIALRVLDDSIAEAPDKEHNERILLWNKAQAVSDDLNRAVQSWTILVQLLSSAGKATACSGNGRNVEIPADALAALVECTSLYIREKQINRQLLQHVSK